MGAELGRISGPLLSANLLRNGVDLAFETNLIYFDVNNQRIGIKTETPGRTLDVVGTTGTTNLIVDTQATIASLIVVNNSIKNLSGVINIAPDPASNPTVSALKFGTANLEVSDQLIKNITNNSNIEISPTGQVVFTTSKVDITGNLHATGNITFDGDIVLGSDDTDSITINADIASHIVPDVTQTYDLGSATQRWNNVYTDTTNHNLVIANGFVINDIDIMLTQGNTFYVSVNGNDTYSGEHLHAPFRTVKKALSVATAGDEVVIFPGTYEEIFPLTVPVGVTVNGTGIRSVSIKPTPATNTNNAFLLNGETTVSNLTVKDFYTPGIAFSFAPSITVTTRSPYIQNVTVLTSELAGTSTPTDIIVGPGYTSTSFTPDSVNLDKSLYTSQAFVDSLVGRIAVLDRYPLQPLYYEVASIITDPVYPTQWRMTFTTNIDPTAQLKPVSFYPNTSITQIVTNDIWDTTGNSVGEKWVAWYKTNLPPFFTTLVQPGWTINVAGTIYIVDYIIEDPVNTNMWRIYVTTSLVAGFGIPIFSEPTVSASIPAGHGAKIDGSRASVSSKEASMLFHGVTMIVPNAIGIEATNGARVEWLNSFTYYAEKGVYLTEGTLGFASQGVKFGAEMRSINSANVYGTFGAVADGAHTLAYLIGHNFGYVGTGTNNLNDNSLVIQANEVVELNGGTVYYDSVDHKGDYRVGDIFYVEQSTGKVSLNAQSIDFGSEGTITFEGTNSSTTINKFFVETGNIRLYDNTVEALSGPINLKAASGSTYLNTNVNITGNLSITNSVNVDGNVFLGDNPLDTITISPNLTQDIIPASNTLTLGLTSTRWDTLYTNLLDVDGVVQIDNNIIRTLTTNTDLELEAAGTGKIQISTTDVQIDNDLTVGQTFTVNGLTSLRDVSQVGNTTLVGDISQTGDTYIIGTFANNNITITGSSYFEIDSIRLSSNEITARTTNDDLIFTGNGTGGVVFDDRLRITGNQIANIVSPQDPLDTTFISSDGQVLTTEDGQTLVADLRPGWDLSVILNPTGTGSVVIDSTKSLIIPVGNNTNRPISTIGEIRQNSTTNLYEGWTPNGVVSFNNVYDSDRNTYVTAEISPNTNDNILRFTTDGVARASIDSTSLATTNLWVDNVRISGNTINNRISGQDLVLDTPGSGKVNLSDVPVARSIIYNNTNNALTLSTTGIGYVKFASTGAIYIPYGNNSARRATPEIGEVRNNSQVGYMEVWNGTSWSPAIGTSGSATVDEVNGIIDLWTLILG